LTVEPHWYEDRVVLRLSCKGRDYSAHTAEMTLLNGDHSPAVSPQTAVLEEAFEGCGRYLATVSFPISALEGESLDGVARILGPDGTALKKVYRHVSLKKPQWVHTAEGHSRELLGPWTRPSGIRMAPSK
jgi:hypothetical protein